MRRRAQQSPLPRANKEGKYFPSVDDDNKKEREVIVPTDAGADGGTFYIMNMTIYIYERCCRKV